jgi:cystathionine beta-synthase
MKQFDISQLPVKENGRLVGMVYEIDLLRSLVARAGGPDDPVGDVAEREFSTISKGDSLARLARLFTEKDNAVLVMDGDNLVSVLTKIDLISHLSRS